MEKITGKIRIAHILQDRHNYRRYLAWKNHRHEEVRPAVRYHVARMFQCRTPALGFHLYRCPDCKLLRIVPHSCKSAFCSSCGTARTQQWAAQALSELLDVPYRHLITAGGLAPDHKHWVRAPARSLVPAVALASEWKARVLRYIRAEHRTKPLYLRRLRGDRRRRIHLEKMFGFISHLRWHVRIGPALDDPAQALQYCGRYSRRPALGEARILRYDGRNVSFRYKDYYNKGRHAVRTLPVLFFIDRLFQHIPDKGARPFRSYGLFASRTRTCFLAKARRALRQRKKRRSRKLSWLKRRQHTGEKRPLNCPHCGTAMVYAGAVFGKHNRLASMLACDKDRPIPTPLFLTLSDMLRPAINQ